MGTLKPETADSVTAGVGLRALRRLRPRIALVIAAMTSGLLDTSQNTPDLLQQTNTTA